MYYRKFLMFMENGRNICMVELLVLLTSDHEVLGSTPTRGRIQLMIVQCFIAQSLSLLPVQCLYY